MKSVIHEHILVCLSSAPSNGNIIRTAAKMRDAFGGSLTALFVETKRHQQMGAEDRQRLERHARLAEKLGANITTVSGDDVANLLRSISHDLRTPLTAISGNAENKE